MVYSLLIIHILNLLLLMKMLMLEYLYIQFIIIHGVQSTVYIKFTNFKSFSVISDALSNVIINITNI